jgi:hypothetical protein
MFVQCFISCNTNSKGCQYKYCKTNLNKHAWKLKYQREIDRKGKRERFHTGRTLFYHSLAVTLPPFSKQIYNIMWVKFGFTPKWQHIIAYSLSKFLDRTEILQNVSREKNTHWICVWSNWGNIPLLNFILSEISDVNFKGIQFYFLFVNRFKWNMPLTLEYKKGCQ